MSTQVESLRRFARPRLPEPRPESTASVAVVAGVKGGVGASTVAALTAIMAAADGISVLLVDAAGGFGALPALLGIQPDHSILELRSRDVSVEELLVPVGGLLSMIVAADPVEGDDATAAERRALLRHLTAIYDRFDFVVVDAGNRIANINAATGAMADRLVAVVQPERISAAAAYALVKVTGSRFPGLPVDVLVNRSSGPEAGETFREIEGAAVRFLGRSLSFAGAVPQDASLESAIAAGMSLQQAALGSPAASCCAEIGLRLRRKLTEGSPAVYVPRISSWR